MADTKSRSLIARVIDDDDRAFYLKSLVDLGRRVPDLTELVQAGIATQEMLDEVLKNISQLKVIKKTLLKL
jgi:hypothetical protein